MANWPLIFSGQCHRTPQNTSKGTHHLTRDVERVDEIVLSRSYTAKELINKIRARTFSPYRGTYFWENGQKIYLRLQLLYEDQIKEEEDGKSYRD